MNLDRLLPKTSFGRFFLINVISLALFWLLIQPMANYWRNQALFRMVASNESRLFLTHIRLLDKLPTIAERNGLFNPNDRRILDPGFALAAGYAAGRLELLAEPAETPRAGIQAGKHPVYGPPDPDRGVTCTDHGHGQ